MNIEEKISSPNYKYYIYKDKENKFFKKIVISEDPIYSEALENEISKLNHMKHLDFVPKIVEYDKNYIIYEYIYGATLDQIDNLSIDEILDIVLKVCLCLKKIHSLKIIHCDLKLSNIVLFNKKIYILDFGSSVYLNEYTKFYGGIYSSLDQSMKHKADYYFDTYSIAVILYKLIEEKDPFKKDKDMIENKIKPFPKIDIADSNISIEINSLIKNIIYAKLDLDSIILKLRYIINFVK